MMFHNLLSVSWCFTCGSRCFMTFHDVSQCFTSVSWCFTKSNYVLRCLVSRATIGIGNRGPPIASGIATTPQGLAVTPQKSVMTPQGMDSLYCRESDPMLNSILNGDWGNTVPGRISERAYCLCSLLLLMCPELQSIVIAVFNSTLPKASS